MSQVVFLFYFTYEYVLLLLSFFFLLLENHHLALVLVYSGCHNKIPQTGWLKQPWVASIISTI